VLSGEPYETLGVPEVCPRSRWQSFSSYSDRTLKEIEAAYDTLCDSTKQIKCDALFTTKFDRIPRRLLSISLTLATLRCLPKIAPGLQSVLAFLTGFFWFSFLILHVDFRFIMSMELAHIASIHLLEREKDRTPVASSKLRDALGELLRKSSGALTYPETARGGSSRRAWRRTTFAFEPFEAATSRENFRSRSGLPREAKQKEMLQGYDASPFGCSFHQTIRSQPSFHLASGQSSPFKFMPCKAID
jgi:hypothetical protein